MKYSIAKDELMVLKEFLLESKEHLDGIEEKVLKLEISKDVELINSIFRPIHTIKGTSSFLGLENIGHLSHVVETLLDDLRKGKIAEIDAEIIDTLLESIDLISKMLDVTSAALKGVDPNHDVIETEIEDIEYEEAMNAVVALREGKSEVQTATPKLVLEKPEIPQPAAPPVIDYAKVVYPREMKEQFELESREHIESIEDILLSLEKVPENLSLYNDLFRALHSIKGNTGVILSVIENEPIRKHHYLNKLREIAHLAESIVQRKRDSNTAFNSVEIQILLNANDYLKNITTQFINNSEFDQDTSMIIGELKKISVDSTGERGADIKQIDGDSLAAAVSSTISQSIQAVEFGLNEILDDAKRQKAINKISRGYKNLLKTADKIKHEFLQNRVSQDLRLVEFLSLGKDPNDEKVVNDLKKDLEEIKKNADRRQEKKVDRRKATIPPPTTDVSADIKIGEKVLKVSQAKIDIFMNLIGELIVSKNNLVSLSRKVSASYDIQELEKKIKESAEVISRISGELQNNIMAVRMLPISNAFSRFPRMIRDLSKKLDKKIKLEISGEETEIDKNIIEALSDPLVHMIRNSVDHGIELPAERAAKGKPEEGTINLISYNQGQYVIIKIIDDGRGIDKDKIRFKALEKGLISDSDLEKMDDQAVLNLIFAPGFSMAKNVTDVSGRGVGMDVVKTNIEKLGGEVSITSDIDKGSTITIRLPLTMAIGRGLEVEAVKNIYYVPIEYIIETLKINSDKIFTYKKMESIVLRDEVIPVYRLNVLLGLEKTNGNLQRGIVEAIVILFIKGQKIGLIVDNYYNENEYVIKPLSDSISNIDGVSGAMITGEGKVHLILDLIKLF